MRVVGQVIKEDGATALVATNRETSCEACVQDDGCGCDDPFFVTAANPIGARAGERVEMNLGSGRMWLTVLIVFWLPLVLGGAGYAAGLALLEATWAGVLGAIFGVGAAIAVIILTERRAAKGRSRVYVITRRL